MMINSTEDARSDPAKSETSERLQNGAAALLSEGIDLLAGEADEQAVLLLMLGDVFDDLRHCLGDGQSLDCSFATQLFRHHPKKAMRK
jgi:hypothetical protein